jgi:hypothetical protein
MKFSSIVTIIATIALLASCSGSGGSGDSRKVVVFSSGKMKQDATNKALINLEPGNRHEELEIPLTGGANKVTVKTPAGEKTYDVPEGGVYLLNLKADTIIGSIVNFGTNSQRTNIDAEELQNMIDSTQKLMTGENASDAKKTYNIPPNSIKKITANYAATILSPYKLIPYEVKVDEKGNPPEYYKFFTNTQKREAVRELIDRLTK